MNKAQPSPLHTEPTRRGGWNRGWDRILFSVLEKQPTKPEVIRVENVLTLLSTSAAYALWMRNVPKAAPEVMKYPSYRRAYNQTVKELLVALKRYEWRITIDSLGDGFTENVDPVSIHSKDELWEYSVIRMLLDLAKEPGQKLSLFRRCQRAECRGWFHAAANHQVFCGRSCLKQNASQSDEFKAKRAAYMKNVYRPAQRKRELDALKLARKGTGRRKSA